MILGLQASAFFNKLLYEGHRLYVSCFLPAQHERGTTTILVRIFCGKPHKTPPDPSNPSPLFILPLTPSASPLRPPRRLRKEPPAAGRPSRPRGAALEEAVSGVVAGEEAAEGEVEEGRPQLWPRPTGIGKSLGIGKG